MNHLIIEVIPYSADNYSYLIHDKKSGRTALVDCGDANPVLDYLQEKGWNLDLVLITHAHHDHAGDAQEISKSYPQATIIKPAGEKRLTMAGRQVKNGDLISFGDHQIEAVGVAAHTRYCTSYHIEGNLFVGDALFSAGCGRLFEGQASDLERVLDKFLSFPDQTKIYVGHEYTLSNLKFASVIEPHNSDIKSYIETAREKLNKGEYTTPTTIAWEKKVNPFLRLDCEEVIHALDQKQLLSRTERVGLLRSKKDSF